MTTTSLDFRETVAARALGPPNGAVVPPQRMHRIRSVRLDKCVPIETVAERMETDVSNLAHQEQERTDLWVSELLRWREALDVPLAELVVDEQGPIPRPALERTRLARLLETAVAIHADTQIVAIRRMARMLVEQLVEFMPDLVPLSPWHDSVGMERIDFEMLIDEDDEDDEELSATSEDANVIDVG